MKLEIPEQLKTDVPQTLWGRIMMATPVVLTVIATMLAGLASSEMTRAQYDRSLAAQLQSKAGDQWSFFQAKRLRGSLQNSTSDVLRNLVVVDPFDPARIRKALDSISSAVLLPEIVKAKADILTWMDSPDSQPAIKWLQVGEVPRLGKGLPLDPSTKAAMEAVEGLKSESEIAPLLSRVEDRTLEEALRQAKDEVLAFDAAIKPVLQAMDHGKSLLDHLHGGLSKLPSDKSSPSGIAESILQLCRSYTIAHLRCNSQRYETEARLNQLIANVYELQVRKSNLSAERHHNRSQRFFFGMLAAQMGVIISTFAIAARQRSFLWALAAAAGLVAVAFTLYVYWFV